MLFVGATLAVAWVTDTTGRGNPLRLLSRAPLHPISPSPTHPGSPSLTRLPPDSIVSNQLGLRIAGGVRQRHVIIVRAAERIGP